MKQVMIVVRDFPPFYHTLGGVIRVLKLADFLQEKGFSVHVVAAAGTEISHFGYENVVTRINVHYVHDRWQQHCNNASITPPADPTPIQPRGTPVSKRIRNVALELSVPDLGIFFVSGLYRKARELVQEHGIKHVIVSSPPFSTQVVGWALKRRFGDRINLIVDYRDSWNTLSIFAKHWRLTRAVNRFMEKRVLGAADHLLYQSPPVIRKIENMFPNTVRDSVLVMNGYDHTMELPKDVGPPKNAILTIGHFGAISDDPASFRNPTPLLQAVIEFNLPIRFEFYGAARLSPHWKELLGDRFFLGGNLPHDDALFQMAQCDVLMLVHSDPVGADEVIPAKIFEYMLTGRPIFAAGPKDMESVRIVRERNLGYSTDILDSADIPATLANLVSDWETGKLVKYDRSDLVEFSRTFQYSKILPILDQVQYHRSKDLII